MSAKRTPGPWEAVAWNSHARTTIKAGDVVVAECSGNGRWTDDSLADARLIAAAPDMLRALQMLADTGRMEDSAWWREAIEARDAAIRKAVQP